MAISLPRDTIMEWNEDRISEHGRASMTVSPTQIETKTRMVDGTLRKNLVAVKNTYSVSWENMPSDTSYVIDGFLGGEDIAEFYYDNQEGFDLLLRYVGAPEDPIYVMFSSFSYEISKRGTNGIDLVNISVEMEEV